MTKDGTSVTCTDSMQLSHCLERTRIGGMVTYSIAEFGKLGPHSSGDAS